jgi:thiamine biosynthesis lipoprotein
MWTFRAMNTDVTVAAERDVALAVEQLFRETERRFSRFLPESELARLNRSTGPVTVSADMLALLLRARAHANATHGIFDPTVGAALHASGYDRSFSPGVLDRDDAASTPPVTSVETLDIDVDNRRVARAPHVQIDFGGFLKGLTADRAAAIATGPILVDAGGDIVLRGEAIVDIEDPHDGAAVIGAMAVRDQAVATSAANRRTWRRGAAAMHHLIDPRTRAPARTDIVQATVLAPTAELADVMAKVAFILGSEAATRELERRGMSAVLVLRGGAIRIVGTVELDHA